MAPQPRRWRLLRHSFVLAKRGVINMLRTPESLIDVTLQPIIFLAMFTYIFGGAIAHAPGIGHGRGPLDHFWETR